MSPDLADSPSPVMAGTSLARQLAALRTPGAAASQAATATYSGPFLFPEAEQHTSLAGLKEQVAESLSLLYAEDPGLARCCTCNTSSTSTLSCQVFRAAGGRAGRQGDRPAGSRLSLQALSGNRLLQLNSYFLPHVS